MLTTAQLLALSPLIILSISATLLMLLIAFYRHHGFNATFAVVGLIGALLATIFLWLVIPKDNPILVTELLSIDRYSCFFCALMLVTTLGCCTLSHTYLKDFSGNREELYLLLLLSLIGAMVLVSSRHFASLFVGLEMLSVPLYGLVAYNRKNSRSLEAGIKYLVLSATGSALLLFGMALLYAQCGTMVLPAIGQQLASLGDNLTPMALTGCTLILIALGFKLSLVPFHLWTPDVYEGAPAPAGAYLATVAKIAVAALLLRWIAWFPIFDKPVLLNILIVLAGLSMLVGNLLALQQNNLKRLLGYSSIGHFGYLLTALAALNFSSLQSSMIYIFTYTFATLAAFGVLSVVSVSHKGETANADADGLEHYRGLFWKQPYLAVIMTVAMLSLAGMPMNMGFIGKFYVILAAINSDLWWLLGILVISSGIGLYYYLRVIVTLFLQEPGITRLRVPFDWSRSACGAMLIITAILIMVLGVYPQPMLDLAQLGSL
ncbi:MAG TPA: NADH-quinone oxidoreductase subunit NuoN [Halioglobus sp.]